MELGYIYPRNQSEMKHIKIIFLAIGILFSSQSFAQRLAYVDSKVVLESLPQYEIASRQLQQMVDIWNQQIEQKEQALDTMKKEFEEEKVLLTEDQISERELEINKLETDLYDTKKGRFGPKGDLYAQRQLLMKPLQDQIYNAISSVAQDKKYDMVFDKASDLALLYTNPKWDITDLVIEKLKN